jgi:hypothetical protein
MLRRISARRYVPTGKLGKSRQNLLDNLKATSLLLKGIDLRNLTAEQKAIIRKYIRLVKKLEREHGYYISFNNVANLRRAISR